jgi:hypothetical protein
MDKTTEPPKTYIYAPHVFAEGYADGKTRQFNLPVQHDQEWLYAMLENQTKLLDRINGKLVFIVVVIIIGIIVSMLRGCLGG